MAISLIGFICVKSDRNTWNPSLSLLSSVLGHCHSVLSLHQHFSEDDSQKHISKSVTFLFFHVSSFVLNLYLLITCFVNLTSISNTDFIILDFSVVLTSCIHSHHGSSFPPWKFLPISFQNDGCQPIQFLIRFLNLFNNLLCFCLNLFHFNLDMIEIKTF